MILNNVIKNAQLEVQVIGLQRSGTNFLSELLKNCQNDYFVIETGNKYYAWKHAMPSESKMSNKTHKNIFESINSNQNLKILLIAKHPLWWLSSIVNRGSADLLRCRPELKGNDQTIDLTSALNLYIIFYRSWLSAFNSEKIYFLRYEDFFDEYDNCLQGIANFLKIDKLNNCDPNTLSVKYSKGSYEDKKLLYTGSDYGLPIDYVGRLTKSLSNLDMDLIQKMGYSLL